MGMPKGMRKKYAQAIVDGKPWFGDMPIKGICVTDAELKQIAKDYLAEEALTETEETQ